jgi:hypothetical protein
MRAGRGKPLGRVTLPIGTYSGGRRIDGNTDRGLG